MTIKQALSSFRALNVARRFAMEFPTEEAKKKSAERIQELAGDLYGDIHRVSALALSESL